MNPELLKQVYDVFAKFEKVKWKITRKTTLLGKDINIIIDIQNFIHENHVSINIDDIKMDKATEKFFDEVERSIGICMGDFDFMSDFIFELEKELVNEYSFIFDIKRDIRSYMSDVFYSRQTLNPWKVVSKEYDYNNKPAWETIKISSDYSATIIKGKPVEVGCQRIPIDIIRRIVEIYDNL